jgi:hypothetical protein
MTGSSLIFNCDDPNLPAKFVNGDPFVKEGITSSHTVIELDKTNKEKFAQLTKFLEYK